MPISRPLSPARMFADLVGTTTPAPERPLLRRVVVMGGSIAGLFAARALSDAAAEVVIVERDELDESADARRGVPHGQQVHALLAAGRMQLDRWFPGFSAACVAEGAFVAPPADLRLALTGRNRRLRSVHPGIMSASRPFLEAMIRRRVLALPAVTVRTGRATGLEFVGETVTGVRVEVDGDERVERADLVVDATGRSSRLGEWLEKAGWERPALVRLPIALTYATGYFAPSEQPPEPPITLLRDLPGRTNVAVYGPIEGERFIVMLSGYDENRPATTIDDFRAQIRDDLPERFTRAAAGEPLGPIRLYHMGDSRRREFASAYRLPARLVAVGDAVASFNPTYGQGISSAALHAVCLESFLATQPDLDVPAYGFFERQHLVVDAAWRMSTITDELRVGTPLPHTVGERVARLLTRFVLTAAPLDTTVEATATAAGFMLVHPDALLSPPVITRAAVAHGRDAACRAQAAARQGLGRLAERLNEFRGHDPVPDEAT
ncbi:FAD-dependent monooxygenase [Pseudonocardia yunnanensis]|uniref:FAD-dependent oxidoreductase n=1 Tax=Pseudonocardia yunnanensis TaxID=58107 RepID=A0ABW4F8W5_9PSEU